MVSVYRDPEGKNVFSASNHSSSPDMAGNIEQGNNATIESLQCKVKELQLALSKYESEQPNKRSSKVTFTELMQNQQHSSDNSIPRNGDESRSATASQ